MNSITKTVKSFFKQEAIKFEQMSHDSIFKIGFAGNNGCFLGYVAVDDKRRTVHIQTISPVKAPRDKRLKAAELIARINHRLLIGNFELDMDSGLIAYRTSIILGNGDLHDDMIEYLLFLNWMAIDRFFPAINLVFFADISPKRAIEMVKKECSLPPDSPDDTNHDGFFHGRLGDILGGSLN